jgi:hypothetical protein
MTNQDCRQALLDFIHDRGPFRRAEDLTGHAASQKPHIFVEYYRGLSSSDRAVMNGCLMSVLLGRDEELNQFAGIILMVVLYITKQISETGLEGYRTDLLDVLKDPKRRESWANEVDQKSNFFHDRRYATGLVNILVALRTPGISSFVEELAASSQSRKFRKALEKLIAIHGNPRSG